VIGYWERLKAAGIEFDRIVSHGNAVGVYFFDPDHNRCEVYWPTGLPARQTYLAKIDLSRPVAELLAEIQEHVEEHGERGFVDSDAAAQLIAERRSAGRPLRPSPRRERGERRPDRRRLAPLSGQ
jgi:hypothetical protein